ncbi:MAG: hypothetical protein EXR98_08775 [Gemmataceae bacterium]|nr:hypothetical protein [Gemmataceae bacterium]
MDNREGIQPESMNPLPGSTPLNANGKPAEGLHEGLPPEPETGAEADAGFFSTSNLIMLGLLGALFAYLLYKFSFEELLNIVKAALGLSFVIFIHELGHFLAAKWCGVNVTTFSIGFGPPIPGCSFQWGETTYKLAILPLGGYVQMVGQIDGDEGADDDDDPRSYRKKTVGQRMLIISAGVIMNAILAVGCFIYVYQGPGKEYLSSAVYAIDSHGPLFEQAVHTGTLITKIGNIDNPTFTDLKQTVVFTRGKDKIPLVFQLPGKDPLAIEIESRKGKGDLMRAIGVKPASKPQLVSRRDAESGPWVPGTSAAAAGFEWDDVIVAMTDPENPERISALPDDPRFPKQGQRDYFEFARRLQLLAAQDITIRVQRKAGESIKEVDVKVAPMYRPKLGIVMHIGSILAVREGSAAHNKVKAPDPAKKLHGDLIDEVKVVPADDTIVAELKTVDPERLPHVLRQWSDRLDKTKFAGDRLVTLKLRRHADRPGAQFDNVEVTLKWDDAWRFDRVLPFSPSSPMPIPELGLAYEIRSIIAQVTDPSSKLEVGDVIKDLKFDEQGPTKDILGKWSGAEIEEGQWAFYSNVFQYPRNIKKLYVKVERSVQGKKEIVELEVPLTLDKSWPLTERGWWLANDMRRVKADNSWHAIQLGFAETRTSMMQVFFTLRGILTGDIDKKVIAGPLRIAYGTYRFASMDFAELVFFLGLISINLAVVNFLPIPILDGGHMVFLVYEKIRGQPASEAVRIWATYAGLAMILALMLFVLFGDVTWLFF